MENQDARSIQTALSQPFAPEDLEWRLQKVIESKQLGIAVPYVTNRAIQNRLDEVVGPGNWYNNYKPWHHFVTKAKSERDPQKYIEKEIISQLCGISIFFEEKQKWITKWDGAENSDIEPIKGGLSDSMKRAAVQWGIGRVLYNMDAVFVDVEQKGKTWYIAKKEQSKLDKAYLDMLKALGLAPAKAGGTQPPLALTEEPETPEGGKAVPKPHAFPKPEQPKAPAAAPQNTSEAEYEYKVSNVRIQNGMNGDNTQLVLEASDGKRISAFVRGAHPELTPGTLLTGTKLTLKRQDTVMFYILEDYRVVSFPQAA